MLMQNPPKKNANNLPIAYCIRELRKCYKVYYTCSKYVEFNALFCGNTRKYKEKNKNGYYKAPLMDILVKYFLAQENMSLLLVQ